MVDNKGASDFARSIFNGLQSVGSKAIETGKTIYETGKEDKEKYEQIKRDSADAKNRMDLSIEEYAKTCLTLRNEFEHLERLTNVIRDSFQNIGISLAVRPQDDMGMQNPEIKDAVMAESILNGVAVGSLAAGSAVLLTASFGTAGTGAAISGLTGTYALNATLAALGGGTLASGGFGIAGGIAVASALFVVPTIAIGAVVAHNKIQKLEKKTQQTVDQVNRSIVLNKQLGERNLVAAAKIRALYDLGTNIKFLLSAIQQRFSYDHKIMAAIQDKLGKAYFEIEIFQGREIHPELDSIIQEIESDVLFLSETFFEQTDDTKARYTEQEINPVFSHIYEDAQEFIYLLYPWFNMTCAKKDKLLLERASKRGVEIYLCYGMGEDNSKNKKLQSSKEAVNWLKREIPRIKVCQVDSHMKIAVCDQYVLHGSQNLMTYRYGADTIKRNDVRSEITTKDTSKREIQEFKRIIEREIFKDV